MEENVALDSEKQKNFVKSIRSIKKLIKKNDSKAEPTDKNEQTETKKSFSMRLKGGKINKKKRRKERGLVYLSHIPHGFYEHQMTEYFKQFGVVTNARVIRSKRTGNSKGFAFVEFKEPAVGQIVAETMNNYLMGKRLIKAAYIPPEKQKRAFRKHWNSVNNPTSVLRLKSKKEFNTDKDDAGELKRSRSLLSNLNKTKRKLSEVGVNYDFFAPVDVPEALLNDMVKQENQDLNVNQEIQPKQGKTGQQEKNEVKKEVKGKKNEKNDGDSKKKVKFSESKANANKLKSKKKIEKAPEVDEKVQKEKEEKLKKAGVKPPQFIKLDEDSCEDSDVSYEYEKMLEKCSQGSEVSSDDEEDSEAEEDVASENLTSGEDSSDEEEDDEEPIPPKKARGRPPLSKKPAQKHQPRNKDQKKPVEAKRKLPQKLDISPRRAKFEKQSQKPMKKAFKKK